jgi:hypothetical protein
MKTHFVLLWHKNDKSVASAFKHKPLGLQFAEYTDRINKVSPCRTSGNFSRGGKDGRDPRSRIWLCEREHPSAKALGSADLAKKLGVLLNQGVNELMVVVGGPDGLGDQDRSALKPDLLWSFGPLTLPHELAALVASEQIYRAWSIIKGLPYHSGH